METYTGQKAIDGYFEKIINNIPKCTAIMEPFAGSASVSRYLVEKGLIKDVYLNDLDFSVIPKLPGSSLDNRGALEVLSELIEELPYTKFIFVDPPYLHSTRSNKNLYKFEISDDYHSKLLHLLKYLKQDIMITHPRCELYDTMLKDWNVVPVTVRYHKKASEEGIYMNYDLEHRELLTYDLYGTDCWDRQRINRKCARHVSKLKALPFHERTKILRTLNESFR